MCGKTDNLARQLGRLIRENNPHEDIDKTTTWCYDISGNILSRTEYAYTTGDLTGIAPTATFAYTYGSNWKDQLVSFNGQSIACDQSGNPTTYRGASLSWTRGRLLASYNSITMQYNANGIRTKKVVPGTNYSTTTEFLYSGNNLLQEKVTRAGISQSSTTYRTYLYNSQGVMGFVQDGAEYIYHKNIFGDIVAIYQGATKVAEYIYDAWGNHKVLDGNSVEVTDPAHIAHQNPFRYRGYFWDSDLQLYYIQGRYYDPQIGRFINVDSLEHLDPVSIGGINLCTYARNNPVGITYVTSKESNSDRESNFIVNSIVGHISSANSNKIDAFFTTENTSELILGVTDASLTIRGLYTSIANLTNHISYFTKNLSPFSLDMRLNGTPMNKAVLAFNNFSWGLDKASVFGVVFSVGLDILDSLHRGVSAEGVVLGAALTAAKGILLIYVNKSIIYLATTIGGMFGVVGAVVGYVIGALICIAVDTYVSRQLDNEIDRIAK